MPDKPMLRLALRQEGEWWNAYIATTDTMDGAHKVGSILLAAVQDNEDRKKAFMDLMQGFMSDVIKQTFGSRPSWWETTAAPSHERAGNA